MNNQNETVAWTGSRVRGRGPGSAARAAARSTSATRRRIGSELSDYAAIWDGYAEAHTFAGRLGSRPPDHRRQRPGVRCRSATRAAASAHRPERRLSAGRGRLRKSRHRDRAHPYRGFLYPIHGAEVQAERIQLGVDPNDLYAAWCRDRAVAPQRDAEHRLRLHPGVPAGWLHARLRLLDPPDGRNDRSGGLQQARSLLHGNGLQLYRQRLYLGRGARGNTGRAIPDRARRRARRHRNDTDRNADDRRRHGSPDEAIADAATPLGARAAGAPRGRSAFPAPCSGAGDRPGSSSRRSPAAGPGWSR